MQIFETIGHVTLSRLHPTFKGGRLVVARAKGAELAGLKSSDDGEFIVVWDDLGAGTGALIAVTDGAEAAQPFKPELKPVDAYNAAILDDISIDKTATKKIKR